MLVQLFPLFVTDYFLLLDPPSEITGSRYVIGGESNQWLNITTTNIIQGGEDADYGNYTCRVCVGAGKGEDCHDSVVTIYLPGAPPIIIDTDANCKHNVPTVILTCLQVHSISHG